MDTKAAVIRPHQASPIGFLTDADIKPLLDREIVIHPYSANNLTPVGYNLSFSNFIYSLATHTFVDIIDNGVDPAYFWIKPNETVLVLTKETIWVSKCIGGTFHSKVSMVTEGLGHVSTTLDPGWQGQLLVPISNPTKRKIKINVMDKDREIRTFITLVLYRSENASIVEDDNSSARLDLLKDIVNEGRPSKERSNIIRLLNDIEKSVYGPPDPTGKKRPLVDLNDPEKRAQKIEAFKQNYDKLDTDKQLRMWQSDLLRCNKSLINNNRANFTFIVIAIFLVLFAISYLSFSYDGTWYGNACKILFPILTPLAVIMINHYKGKYI